MPAPRRAEYDDPEFWELWWSQATLSDIAARYGVSVTAVWLAGKARGFPNRNAMRAQK